MAKANKVMDALPLELVERANAHAGWAAVFYAAGFALVQAKAKAGLPTPMVLGQSFEERFKGVVSDEEIEALATRAGVHLGVGYAYEEVLKPRDAGMNWLPSWIRLSRKKL